MQESNHEGAAPEEPLAHDASEASEGADEQEDLPDDPLVHRILELEAELAEAKDRYVRSLAEMDNVRRRGRLDAEDARRFAVEKFASELLPVLDNFALALRAAELTPTFETLKDGVALIHRQLSEVLARGGVERIEALGQPFDPNFHQAIMQVEPKEGQEPHQVVEELRCGFKLHDRVLRPSLVKVTSG
jgi:molecular chaperone GrpE